MRHYFLLIVSLFSFSSFSQICLSPQHQALLYAHERMMLDRQAGNTKSSNSIDSKIADLQTQLDQIEGSFDDEDGSSQLDTVKEWFKKRKRELNRTLKKPIDEIEVLGLEGQTPSEASIFYEEGDLNLQVFCKNLVKSENKDSCEKQLNNFYEEGELDSQAFCDKFAKSENEDSCERHLEELVKLQTRQDELKKRAELLKAQIEKLEYKKFDKESQAVLSGDDSVTEADACLECEYIKEWRAMQEPTLSEKVTGGISLALGAGLSYFGLREARRAQRSANDLRVEQGFAAENNFNYSLAGASIGYPFIQKGLLGLSRGNTARGGLHCSNVVGQSQYNAYRQPGAYPFIGGGGFNGGGSFIPGAGPGTFFPGFNGGGSFIPGAGPGALFPGFNGGASLNVGAGSLFPGFNGGGFLPGQIPGAGPGALFPGFNGGASLNVGAGSLFPGFNGGGFLPGQIPGAGPGAFFPGFNGGASLNVGAGPGSLFPGFNGGGFLPGQIPGGFNPGANQQLLFQQQQQQAYYQQVQQASQQLQLQLKMQQAWLAEQQSAQEDSLRRQKVIGELTQELHRIQSQIRNVASGGSYNGLSQTIADNLLTGGNSTNPTLNNAPVTTPPPSSSSDSSVEFGR